MAATHKGECFCGAVHVEVSGEPEVMGYCHCQSCRSWSAARSVLSPFGSQTPCGLLRVRNMLPRSKRPNSVNGNTARNAVAIS